VSSRSTSPNSPRATNVDARKPTTTIDSSVTATPAPGTGSPSSPSTAWKSRQHT
jgi:hypothetical protein